MVITTDSTSSTNHAPSGARRGTPGRCNHSWGPVHHRTAAGVACKITSAPVRGADLPFAAAAQHSGAVVTTALLVLTMGLSLAFVPAVLNPVLRPRTEMQALWIPDHPRSSRDDLLHPLGDQHSDVPDPG